MVERRLYRSKKEKMIAGVCGGFAEYLDIDPTFIRLLWAIFICFAGSGILIYILACIIIPNEETNEKNIIIENDAKKVDIS